MRRALWFSRHNPTNEQLNDAQLKGYEIIVNSMGLALGKMDLKCNNDIITCIEGLVEEAIKNDCTSFFGVFPTPILMQIARTSDDILFYGPSLSSGKYWDYPCFAAWNIMRSNEGEKPTFDHKEWIRIGHLNLGSCKWLYCEN